ncbi:MAG: hypothetical protein ABI208_03190 [Ginsengibacter sp.]
MALISLASCKKNNLVVGKTLTQPAFVKIGTWVAGDTVGTYAVKSTNQPFKIPIGVTNVTNADRTVTLTYTSATAVQGVDYTAPATMVIKAGAALDSLPITGNFASFGGSVTKSHKIVVTISGGDIATNPTKTHYNLTMKMFWEADANAFSGVYNITDYYNGVPEGGPYTVVVTPVSGSGPTSVISIDNLWGSGVPAKVTLNWGDLNSGTTAVVKANWFVDGTYGQATINPATTAACVFTKSPKKLTIGWEATVAAGSFGKYISILTQP